jgi:hypothetical protein
MNIGKIYWLVGCTGRLTLNYHSRIGSRICKKGGVLSLGGVGCKCVHCKKMVVVFSVPSQDVTYQTLPGLELLNLDGRVWLVTSRPETGKTITFFTV